MKVNLPPPGTPLPRILAAIQQAFTFVVSTAQGVNRIILISPNGTNYAVTVDDAGALKTEVIDGKARPR
jgi:hypothetical protein